jgi:hypothetical protein
VYLFVVATSNVTDALDEAFLPGGTSGSDAAILVPLPDAIALHAILCAKLTALGARFAPLTPICTQLFRPLAQVNLGSAAAFIVLRNAAAGPACSSVGRLGQG